MKAFLGIDTSNYTTSCALYFPQSGEMISEKMLLPVKKGERGIRQSDAVFHHTKQLNIVMKKLFCKPFEIEAVGYSAVPRLAEGSYMPCFLAGENTALNISYVMGKPAYGSSHQCGHVLAGLYSCGRLDLLKGDKPFLAFHVSGGTTDLLLCRTDRDKALDIVRIGGSNDLKAGQAVDRIGVKMGLDFPAGKYLEQLALLSRRKFDVRPSVRGLECSLSGVENKCLKMLEDNESRVDIALFCLEYIYSSLRAVTEKALKEYGSLPVIFVGGVMSNSIIREKMERKFECFFAEPKFSSDNAAGAAVFAAFKKGMV